MITHRASRLAAAGIAALVLLGLAGCGAAGSVATDEPMPGVGTVAGAPPGGEAKAGGGGTENGAETSPTDLERKVARTASMTLVIGDPTIAAQQVRLAAQAQGGHLLSESIVTEKRNGLYVQPSTVVVAVPGDALEQSLDSFATLGEATYRAVTAEDVTTQVVDVDARIKLLRESIARIEKLMAKAGSISQIAQVESELTIRQQELESMVAQQRALANRVQMAPVTITLRPSTGVTDAPNPLWQGLSAGLDALLASLRVLVVVVGVVIPFLALGLLIGLPLWLRRRHLRRAASAVPDAHDAADGARPDDAAQGADEADVEADGEDTDGEDTGREDTGRGDTDGGDAAAPAKG